MVRADDETSDVVQRAVSASETPCDTKRVRNCHVTMALRDKKQSKIRYDNATYRKVSAMTTAMTIQQPTARYQPFIQLVCDGVTSAHSKRAYATALEKFLSWCDVKRVAFTKASVQAYRAQLERDGMASSSVAVQLAAVRKLAMECHDNGIMPTEIYTGIQHVQNPKRLGRRTGNWLSKELAARLVNAPDTDTTIGIRDGAILAMLVGGGIRRDELAHLDVSQIQQRDSRWVLVDVVGKGKRTRTVPIPNWTKQRIDKWLSVSAVRDGKMFRHVKKNGQTAGHGITSQCVYLVVGKYARQIGVPNFAAHDTRRTFARLARLGGAPLEQIQHTLGHSSIQTTERYLNMSQRLDIAPCDFLGLDV